MNYQQLVGEIKRKQSFLCVGLDTDLKKIPSHIRDKADDPVFEFNKAIIDATLDYAIAYKPNLAFYEASGVEGLKSLEKTIQYINGRAFTIADAKRGDIGNTAEMYAHAFYNHYGFDSITLSPYMGADTIEPFLKHKDKWSIILALTSNPGAEDFEMLKVDDDFLFEKVLKKFGKASAQQIMFVVGATRPQYFEIVRKHAPDNFLLVPGIGAQGGSLEDVCRYGLNSNAGLIVNSSRQIIYADSGIDFDVKAAEQAKQIQQQMKQMLVEFKITG